MRVILASKSPRRKELLKEIFQDFIIIPSTVDENKYSLDKLSFVKAEEISNLYPSDLVISADTLVYLDNKILGKPIDEKDAFKMLKSLSNKTHVVTTYYSIFLKEQNIFFTNKSDSYVTFNELSDELINDYIKTGSPLDKAGAYGIQDKEFNLVKEFTGELNNIIGLPTYKLKQDLIRLGIILKDK